jgi:rfaE bifunctional protein nucleotidyltransferase chain/domain
MPEPDGRLPPEEGELPRAYAAKLLDLDAARRRREELEAAGRRLVLTNGVFDILHAGHVRYLIAARALGDALFVGLNDDRSARRNRGAGRPLQPAADRALVLAALACVDGVVPFGEETAEALVDALRPDVYVKGGDYFGGRRPAPGGEGKPLPEAEVVRRYGGDVRIIPYLPGRSTTELIERIRAAVAR